MEGIMRVKAMIAALAAVGFMSAGLGIYADHNIEGGARAAPTPNAVSAPHASERPGDFAGIAAQYGPAVVNISVIGKAQSTADAPGVPGIDPNDPFFEFFRRFGPQVPRGNAPLVRGQGSGFIVSPDGIILTNAHVVDGAKEVTVRLTDRREFTAKVTGSDSRTDVAVIKIDAKNLPTVKLGDPHQVRVGNWVLAIGSPYGFENSVTAGIVSAKSRSLPDGTYVPFIQTDVAVNPGNSGGPLFNTAGEVVGINSQIFSRTGGYQGLSFAIPIDVATKVKDQLLAHGSVTRGYLGIGIQDVTHGLSDSFGLQRPAGALIGSVTPDSPAAKAGLKSGDVILKVEDKAIERSTDLPAIIADMAPGTKANLEVWRKGSTRTIQATIGALEPDKIAAADLSPSRQGKPGP
jgi:serine protease Do